MAPTCTPDFRTTRLRRRLKQFVECGEVLIGGETVARCLRGNRSGYEQEANAELITRLLNFAHAGGVQKLRLAFELLAIGYDQAPMRAKWDECAERVTLESKALLSILETGAEPSSSVPLCDKCGSPLEMSAGWVPSYADPGNSGLLPMAEPFCPKCER